MRRVLAAALLTLGMASAHAANEIEAALNEARARSANCAEGATAGAAPLTPNALLGKVAGALAAQPGAGLNATLNQFGYHSRKTSLLRLTGPAAPAALAQQADQNFCQTLRSPDWSEIGTYQTRQGDRANTWIVLARPLDLPGAAAGPAQMQRVLDLVNQARARPRNCGTRRFAAAPPLSWDQRLERAAQAHATDMARHEYFSHQGRDGAQAAVRVQRAGYAWRAVGENIAAGQPSAEEVTAGWIASPGHCANLMNPAFTQMGVAYAVNPTGKMGIYWTQVFGTPK